MGALTLLKDEHDRINELLADGEQMTDRAEKTRAQLFDTERIESTRRPGTSCSRASRSTTSSTIMGERGGADRDRGGVVEGCA